MDDFHNLSDKIAIIQEDVSSMKELSSELQNSTQEDKDRLQSLTDRVKALLEKTGQDSSNLDLSIDDIQQINSEIDEALFSMSNKTDSDKALDLNKVDILIACIAGGLAVLVDFLVVKVPMDMDIKLNGEKVHHEGSPLTELFRKIGTTKDGKEAKWIQTLEKWFHVNYDPSIKENIPGMYPKNHRVYSLGHDPSILGLIWGIKDIVCGTFSYIDKNGVLRIDKVAPADVKKLFYAPVLWLGHIISDVFTKQGIPIPGTSVLRMLKVGSFGEKDRTIGELVTYMYEKGYDLRHLATMSTCRLVIDVVINIYYFLVIKKKTDPSQQLFERDYVRVKNTQKKSKMSFTAYSIAVAGNIGKVAAYQGSPFAINTAIWYQFAREAITQVVIYMDDGKYAIEAIENRHLIDETFERLLKQSNSSYQD